MFDLSKIQSALRQFNLDGWLIYDFRGNRTNPSSTTVSGVPPETSR